MEKKRKISFRKVLRAFVTLVVAGGSMVAVLGASRMQEQQTVRKVQLHVRNDSRYLFLDKQELWKDLVEKDQISAGKTRISGLDIRSIEKRAYNNLWVSDAQVFVDNRRDMHIYVTQKIPVARVFFEDGTSAYIDTSLNLLPLSDLFTYYTTIVTNVPLLANDSLNRKVRAEVVRMVRFVERDPFWAAQVGQINMTPELQFELIPVMGTHKILFGDTTDMVNKFGNLLAFYRNVLNRIGWDKYELLDLRFRNQVVASPWIPWKAPGRNAISNMDWLKNIMEDAPKDSSRLMKVAAKPAVPSKPEAVTKPVTQAKPAIQQKPAAAVKPVVKGATPLRAAAPVKRPEKRSGERPASAKTTEEKKENPDKPQTGKYIYQGKTNN